MTETVYKLFLDQANRNFLRIEILLPVTENKTELFLAAWRPGRYEEGNFSKNIKNLCVHSDTNRKLDIQKTSKESWVVSTENCKFLRVSYLIYAKELNAGSTYIDDLQISINPINSFIYSSNCNHSKISIELQIPSNYKIATSLLHEKNILFCNGLDELFDSPFIASAQLSKESYSIGKNNFHIWFNQLKPSDFEKICKDFEAFTLHQIEAFGEIPTQEFHFLIQCLPLPHFHGVEHVKSTMIALGPQSKILNEKYDELLSIASHELYHVWNVKTIRPVEMMPYKLQEPNYSFLGYIYEGVTTFMGDYFLLKSNLYDPKKYLNSLQILVQKHFDNFGRFAYSVAESSFDTWVDGYVPGIPGRKVSIYNEGALLAFVMDTMIRKSTNHKCSLQSVMNRLYFDFGCKGIGYTEEDYKRILKETSGIDFHDFFNNYIHGTQGYEKLLIEAFDFYGILMKENNSSSYSVSKLGMKTNFNGHNFIINEIAPGSPAELGGLSEHDAIIAINSIEIKSDLDAWLGHFENETKTILISRKGRIIERNLPEVNRCFYSGFQLNYLDESILSTNIVKNRKLFGWE